MKKYEIITPYSRMATTRKHWCTLNENDAIRVKCHFCTVLHLFRGEEQEFDSKGKWQLFCNINWLTSLFLFHHIHTYLTTYLPTYLNTYLPT